MKVKLFADYKGNYDGKRLILKAGEHDLDSFLVEFLERDSPGLFPAKEVRAPDNKMLEQREIKRKGV